LIASLPRRGQDTEAEEQEQEVGGRGLRLRPWRVGRAHQARELGVEDVPGEERNAPQGRHVHQGSEVPDQGLFVLIRR